MVERRRTCVERQLAENSLQPDRRPSASVWTNFGTLAQCVEYQSDAFMAVSMGFLRCAEKAFPWCGKARMGARKSMFGHAERAFSR